MDLITASLSRTAVVHFSPLSLGVTLICSFCIYHLSSYHFGSFVLNTVVEELIKFV